MKAVVLSGGEGSRLRPITHTRCKQLIPVVNKPVLAHILEGVAAAGILDVAIVVGQNHDMVRSFFRDGQELGLKITYLFQPWPGGLAHAVNQAKEYVGDEPFLVQLGDNLLRGDLSAYAGEFAGGGPEATVLLGRVNDPRRYGVVELAGENVVALEEKPKQPRSNLVLTGVYFFRPTIFDIIDNLRPSQRGELELTDAIQGLVSRGSRVMGKVFPGWWCDTGRPQDILEANRKLSQGIATINHARMDKTSFVAGPVSLAPGTLLAKSCLYGPVVTGLNCVIEGSFIGPNVSMGSGCRIVDACVEDSVLLDGVELEGVSLKRGLLGRGVVVRGGFPEKTTLNLILGDDSLVEIDSESP